MNAFKGGPTRGFTLIEIMVVVAITAVLTTLSVVGYQSVMMNARTNGEADVISMFLKNARLRAVSTGCPHVVRYNGQSYSGSSPARSLTMYRKAGCTVAIGTITQNTTVTPNDVVVNNYQLTANMNVVGGAVGDLDAISAMVAFSADGTPLTVTETGGATTNRGTGAQQITIKAKSTEVYSRVVILSPAGDVYVQ